MLLLTGALFAKSKEVILGEKAYSRGALDAAKDHFEQAIENGDETGDPRLYIGLILESRRQYAESIPYFRAAAERPMSNKKFKKVAYWKLVILYRQAKQYPEALRYVERLEDLGEKSDMLEKIRDEAGSYEGNSATKGYADIKKASALEKEYAEKLAKGEDADELRELAQSIIDTYGKAIAQDAAWKDYRLKIARYQEKLKQTNEAEATYRQIWQESADPGAAYKLGLFARKSGNYRKALEYFAAALEKPVEDPQLKFYLRLNAAQSRYGLGQFPEAFKHAKAARSLAAELELKKKTLLGLRRVYCLSRVSVAEPDDEYCRFGAKADGQIFVNLYSMKRALALKQDEKAAGFAVKIYEKEISEDDESEKSLPAYAMSDLPVAISVLFRTEKYRAVLQLTDRFEKTLSQSREYYGWRAVSHFALKEYGSALIDFDKVKSPTPSQMNLHLMAMAQMGDIAGIKSKGKIYLQNPKAREKLVKNFRKLKIYEPLRQQPDFEAWLSSSKP